MKIKQGFVLRKVSNYYAIIAVGKVSKEFKSVITLNDSAKLMWERLEKGATESDLVATLISEYEIDEATALADARKFVEDMRGIGVIEE